MIKRFTYIFLLLVSLHSFAQDPDYSICDCCTYSGIRFGNDFQTVFPPAVVRENKITELTIYTTSKQKKPPSDTSLKVVDKEYREMIFRFNGDGYVVAQTVFNRRGKYHSVNEFARSPGNDILYKTFHYLDESGSKMTDFGAEKWVYTYKDHRVAKIKKLDYNMVEQPDAKSEYETHTYDSIGRVIGQIRYAYYDPEVFQYTTKITYNNQAHTSVAVTRDKKAPFTKNVTSYTPGGKMLNEKVYSETNKKLLEEKMYSYDGSGQLIKSQVKNSGMGTECPDGGNWINTYTYSALHVISTILHTYKNTSCEMRFVYK